MSNKIEYTNIQRYDNLDFAEYLRLSENAKRYSHSFLKGERGGIAKTVNVTDNMRLGSLVDGILLEPHTVNMRDALYPVARGIAAKIRTLFGPLITSCQKQVSYTAEMVFQGLMIPTTGRLDMQLGKHAVIDLKVTTSKDLHALIAFMGYENQLWHYLNLSGCPVGYLMIHSIPLDRTQVIKINRTERNLFFESKILDFGKVVA